MGSFATELVTAGHKIENETELPSCSFQPNLAFWEAFYEGDLACAKWTIMYILSSEAGD